MILSEKNDEMNNKRHEARHETIASLQIFLSLNTTIVVFDKDTTL
jgi:hypothetical protein